jgi:hypothetical protein
MDLAAAQPLLKTLFWGEIPDDYGLSKQDNSLCSLVLNQFLLGPRNIILYFFKELVCRWFRFAQLAKGKKFRP